MQNDRVQRPCNAKNDGCNARATVGATPVQRPCNDGETHPPGPRQRERAHVRAESGPVRRSLKMARDGRFGGAA